MTSLASLVCDGRGAASNRLIRILVGVVFLSEGVQKCLFSDALGVGRFVKIGIPIPQLSSLDARTGGSFSPNVNSAGRG